MSLVETTTLLTWQGVKSLEGSNPSLSANIKIAQNDGLFLCWRRGERQLLVFRGGFEGVEYIATSPLRAK